MADLLEQASVWLGRMRASHMGRKVTYRRGQQSVEVTATVGQTTFEVINDSGFAELVHSRDYLIAADTLVISGTAVIPKPGDRIEELLNGQTLVHDVMSPDQGKPCWRYSDPYRRTMRIHTKQTEVN